MLKSPSSLQLYQIEIPTQVFSWEICETFKNIFFLQTTSGDCLCRPFGLLIWWIDNYMSFPRGSFHFRVILVRIFPVFSCIRTECGEILRISPYSVRMRENTGKMRTRITPNTDTFYAVLWSLNLWNKVNLEHSTIAVWNLAQSWSISKCFLWRRKIGSFCFTTTNIVIFVYCLYKGLYIRHDFC